MNENNYENYDDDIFICNAQECFISNANNIPHLKEKNLRTNHKNKCSLCAYDFDNLEELREQIHNEMQLNKLSKRSIIKAKIIEAIIAVGLGIIVFYAVVYFIFKAYGFNR